MSSARQAAEWLLFRWPNEIDAARNARRAKLASTLERQREAASARKAFREAAQEAGILIGGASPPSPNSMKRKR
ncbi:DUF982 domain-containing protein [Mesorhizobium sp. AaZ16]|uniref:DUF982 domain-containing protein n=1 Tax=Mesorhizobium sp. AaZ16 TaxID=3402289 RepID=UPI00374FAD1A